MLWVLRWAAVGVCGFRHQVLRARAGLEGGWHLALSHVSCIVPWVPPVCGGAGEGSHRPDLTLLPKLRLPGAALLQPEEPVSARRLCHFPCKSAAISLWPCSPWATPAH